MSELTTGQSNRVGWRRYGQLVKNHPEFQRAWLGKKSVRRIGLWFTWSIVTEGVSLGVVGAAPALWVSAFGNFILGVSVSTAGVPLSTMFQSLVPGDMRARVGSITNATSSFSIPVTYGLVGVLADHIGSRWTYGCGAICLVLVGFVALAIKSVRVTGVQPVSDTSGEGVAMS